MDDVFLTISGLLLGSFLYSGFYTIRYEPEVQLGYIVVGAGLVIAVALNVWIDIIRDVSDWFRAGTLAGYALVTVGLALIMRARRHRHRDDQR